MTSNQDILNCELEPIRFPGAVQSHGALVVLGKDGLTIAAASESCTLLLGRSPASLIGQTVDRLFGSEHASRLVSCQGSALTPLVPLTTEQGRYWARSSCNAEGQVLIDIEPASQRASANELLYQCRHSISVLRCLNDVSQIAAQATQIFQELTGFDRVMVYQFDNHWNGEVMAETRVDGIEPYLGLNFPASDIPKQARELFKASRVRQIPDACYTPSALFAAGDSQSIDLGPSSLRSVSPLHLEYLANMQVRATLVGSLLVDGELWGLISCQHKTEPKYFSPDERDALGWFCEDIASLIEGTLARQKRILEATLTQRRRRLADLMRTVDFKTLTQEGNTADLLDVVNADGFCLLIGDDIQITGVTPGPDQIRQLQIRRSAHQHNATVFASNCMADDFGPDMGNPGAAGALFVSVLGKPNITMIWFRKERQTCLRWGGNPERAHLADTQGRLSPRKSFAQFLQTVSGHGLPWLVEEISSASELGGLIEIELLRQREAFAQVILNSIPEHIAVLDSHGVIAAVNGAWKQFAKDNGAANLTEAFVGMNYKNCCVAASNEADGSDVADIWPGIEAVLQHRSTFFSSEYPCDLPDGQRWFRMTVFPLQGAGEGAVVSHEDITSRKLTEIALRESEARFRELFENNSSIMGLVDPSTGTIVEANLAAASYYGYARENMAGMSLGQINVLPVEEVAKMRTLALSGERKSFELQHRLASGQVRDVEVHSTPIISGGRTLLFSIINDVTERRHADEARNEALGRLQKIANRVPGMVYQYRSRPDGCSGFPFASEAIREVYRVTPEEVQQDAGLVFKRLHPDDHDRVSASIQHSAATLTRWDCDYRVKFEDGTVRWLHGSAFPERESDSSTLWHGYIQDVSDRKAIEAELANYRDHLEELVAQQTQQLQQSVSALREREDLFRLLAQNTSDGLAVFENNAIVYASPTYLQILGYEEHEEMGRDQSAITALIHPDDIDRVLNVVFAAIHGRAANAIYTYRARHKKGHYLWREDSTRFIYQDDGSLYRSYVVARDVSENVKTRAELEKIAELLKQTGKVAKIGGWELDLPTMLVDWSEQVFQIFEREPCGPQKVEQAVTCYVPDSQAKIRTALAQAVNQGLDWSLELEAVTDKGHVRWVQTLGEVVREGGQIVRIFGSARDITAEVLHRRADEEHQQMLQMCFDNLQTGVAVFSETALLYCNQAFRFLLGYPDHAPMAKLTMESLVLDVDQDDLQAGVSQADAYRGTLPPRLMKLSGNNGVVVNCLLSGSIVPWMGESQFLASITPISDADRIEMEMRATEERFERLLVAQLENQQADIARELHDSLGSRLAGVAMLLGGIEQRHPELDTQIKMARNQVQIAAEISRNLARGLMPVDASSGSFWRALERLCLDYQQLAGVQCIFSLDGDFEGVSSETGNHLFRIAQEALVNAVKHGHASTIQVTLEERLASYVMLVADNGRQTPESPMGAHSFHGIGLKSMQARAKSIGAVFRWYTNADGGVTVAIDWPIPA